MASIPHCAQEYAMPEAKQLRRIQPPRSANSGVLADIPPPQRRACSRRRLHRGEALCSAGELFQMLHVVCSGTLKCFVMSHNGAIQVTGFQIAGDIVGLDGIGSGLHPSNAVALDDAEVFVLPFAQCEQWSQESAYSQHLLMRTLAQETTRGRQHMLALRTMRAEQRMAVFLLDLSRRYDRLGDSSSRFMLGMPRQDIGSYLGLTLETVSRLLSRLQREGMLQVQGRSIVLLDFPALRQLAGVSTEHRCAALDPLIDRMGNFAVPPH
jgi:CRP/FNR family transcriptional regulator, anaerobic regulatory protein